MLKITLLLILITVTPWVAPSKRLWQTTCLSSLAFAIFCFMWYATSDFTSLTFPFVLIDNISYPLVILTSWLTTPTLLASQSKISKEPILHQRIYIFSILLLQTITISAFMVNDLIMFFILFEASLIPTLILITRWGTQKERMMAGIYLTFFTLFGSMTLLMVMLFFHEYFGTLVISMMKISIFQLQTPIQEPLWSICLLAFLVKMPLFGLHLWLPKAHVEAPIAGSMILAGTLLKLGGYGILRFNLFTPDYFNFPLPLITLSLLGVFLSSSLCMRQTDLKSLIAYSSISHMGLVIAASLLKTPWGINGSIILMVSHGLVSSALFCLANTTYERTNTRTMALLRASQIVFPLTAAWWLTLTFMNMALPPSANFVAEMLILMTFFKWACSSLMLAGLTIILTTIYTLYLFWSTQREYPTRHTKTSPPIETREHLLILLHLIPLFLISLNPLYS